MNSLKTADVLPRCCEMGAKGENVISFGDAGLYSYDMMASG